MCVGGPVYLEQSMGNNKYTYSITRHSFRYSGLRTKRCTRFKTDSICNKQTILPLGTPSTELLSNACLSQQRQIAPMRSLQQCFHTHATLHKLQNRWGKKSGCYVANLTKRLCILLPLFNANNGCCPLNIFEHSSPH